MLHDHRFTAEDFNPAPDSAIAEGREGEAFVLTVSFVHSHELEDHTDAEEHDHPLTVAFPVAPVRGVPSVVSFRHVVA